MSHLASLSEFKKNKKINKHFERKHTQKQKDMTANDHLKCEFIQLWNFTVALVFHCMSNLKPGGKSACFLWICRVPQEHEISMVSYQCLHLKSVPYCTSHAPQLVLYLLRKHFQRWLPSYHLVRTKSSFALFHKSLLKTTIYLSLCTIELEPPSHAKCIMIYELILPY